MTSAQDFPFFTNWDDKGELPDFRAVKPAMFLPAFRQAMAEHRAEVDKILASPQPATFENTLVPLELAGANLARVQAVFGILSSTRSTKALQKIEETVSPELSRHYNEIYLLPQLFSRIDDVYKQRASLSPEARRLVEERHRDLVLNGAGLPPDKKTELIEVSARISGLGSRFASNLTNQVDEQPLVIAQAEQLAGVGAGTLEHLRQAAQRAGHSGYDVSLQRHVVEDLLKTCKVRETRRQVHEAFMSRCDRNDAYDNKKTVAEILQLRQQQAGLLGQPTYAHVNLAPTMTGTPEAVRDLLLRLWGPAKNKMAAEQQELEEVAKADGLNEPLQPWDWLYYAEAARRKFYDLDEQELRPYLSLPAVQKAAFQTAEKLFGIKFRRRRVKAWHADVRGYDVIDKKTGEPVGLFLTDYFARKGKHSGAWMSELVEAHGLGHGHRPIIYNVCNFTRPAKGKPALLSLDDAVTLFHELGHGLHGLLSKATYPSLSGINVYSDFVEFPSQLFEHWLTEPKVMKRHLRHVETKAEIPDALIEKITRSSKFGEGFETVRYLASALVDLELHQMKVDAGFDIAAAERDLLRRYALPEAGQMMHRPPHHHHIFSSNGYAARYSVYILAAVAEHDAFAAFEEKGDPFHRATAEKLRVVYAAGNTRHPADLYRDFRGREPRLDALLKNKGFPALS